MRARSSIGQSGRLRICRLGVQIPPGAPIKSRALEKEVEGDSAVNWSVISQGMVSRIRWLFSACPMVALVSGEKHAGP